jgi:hypothetical protein
METQVQGRSMKELRAIIAAEDARRNDLMDAWDGLTEDAQVELVLYARGLAAGIAAEEAATTREP